MVTSGNHLNFFVNFSGSNISLAHTSSLVVSTWYHTVVTVDRSGVATMYLNGTPFGTTLDVSAGVAVDLSNPNPFAVGHIGDSIGADGYYFDGSMRRVRLWRGRILSSDDVTSLYNGGSGLAYTSF